MSSRQAAAALGVKSSSLYAYVSRGVIARDIDVVAGRRVSRFRREDVLALAEQRTRPRSGALTTLIESDVSQLDVDGGLAFRGVDLAKCAERGFEWTAAHVLGDTRLVWPTPGMLRPSMTDAPCPGVSTRVTDMVRHAVMAGAAADPWRSETSMEHCRQVAISTVELAVESITTSTAGWSSRGRRGGVASRLARHWSAGAGQEGTDFEDWLVRVVDAALTVLVDHELTASTLAARAAAELRADPWMVLLTGLAAMSGPGQAGASRAALATLRRWRDGIKPEGERIAGFGHKVYVGADPRADLLLAAIAELRPTGRSGTGVQFGAVAGSRDRAEGVLEAVDGLAIHVARTRGQYPNVDLAVAALIDAAGLPLDAGEVIFTIARIPGLMAHATEEYPHGLRLRPRAVG